MWSTQDLKSIIGRKFPNFNQRQSIYINRSVHEQQRQDITKEINKGKTKKRMVQSSQPSRSSKKANASGSANTRKRTDKKERDSITRKQQPRRTAATASQKEPAKEEGTDQLDLFGTKVPLSLQQLLLNVFKAAFLYDESSTPSAADENESEQQHHEKKQKQLDIKPLIQTIKSHLYNRDFDSAFTDASEDLLRAYALRWSASRALGYVNVFKSVLGLCLDRSGSDRNADTSTSQIVCIGGGAGAEIVALAAVWRDFVDSDSAISSSHPSPQDGNGDGDDAGVQAVLDEISAVSLGEKTSSTTVGEFRPSLSIKAVDIADWSSVVERLNRTLRSSAVPGSKAHPAPLLPSSSSSSNDDDDGGFNVHFTRADVLSLNDNDLERLFQPDPTGSSLPTVKPNKTVLVTLMFTLNELFSTSMAKATAFLLRMTDLLEQGTMLLVLDSPGSYSTLTLGGGNSKQAQQDRRYPMKFLLDHTLLSVAKGKWERVFSQDSRWWRRDVARLRYEVGEGVGLEDMRFQVHIYRRLDG